MFKKGDRVVLVCSIEDYGITKSGWAGTYVGDPHQAGRFNYVEVIWDDYHKSWGETLSVRPEHLIAEEVYNSPLYKALL